MAGIYTIHGVLAGAYKGRQNDRVTLYHASINRGETSLCNRIKNWRLADPWSIDPKHPPFVTCEECLARIARRGLVYSEEEQSR
jgi:hypothetical protein